MSADHDQLSGRMTPGFFMTLLQILNTDMETGVVTIDGPSGGQLFYRNGQLIHASTTATGEHGEDAVLNIWRRVPAQKPYPQFRWVSEPHDAPVSIQTPHQNLLMNLAQRVDEEGRGGEGALLAPVGASDIDSLDLFRGGTEGVLIVDDDPGAEFEFADQDHAAADAGFYPVLATPLSSFPSLNSAELPSQLLSLINGERTLLELAEGAGTSLPRVREALSPHVDAGRVRYARANLGEQFWLDLTQVMTGAVGPAGLTMMLRTMRDVQVPVSHVDMTRKLVLLPRTHLAPFRSALLGRVPASAQGNVAEQFSALVKRYS